MLLFVFACLRVFMTEDEMKLINDKSEVRWAN